MTHTSPHDEPWFSDPDYDNMGRLIEEDEEDEDEDDDADTE